MSIFNEYGNIPINSEYNEWIESFYKIATDIFKTLNERGASIVEIRAFESLINSSIGAAASGVIFSKQISHKKEEKNRQKSGWAMPRTAHDCLPGEG